MVLPFHLYMGLGIELRSPDFSSHFAAPSSHLEEAVNCCTAEGESLYLSHTGSLQICHTPGMAWSPPGGEELLC